MAETDSIAPTPSEEEKRLALAAALGSETLARSEQLRAFLAFVCDMEMAGRGPEISEYLIGVKALGRPESYSPLEDSSVRTRAYELRHRLLKYYAVENPEAAVRIELPKGSYAPRFVAGPPVAPVEAVPDAPLATLPDAPVRSPGIRRAIPWVGGFLAGVAAAGLAAMFWAGRVPGAAVDAVVQRAWAPLVSKDAEVLISIGAPLHLQVTPYLAKVPETVTTYPAPDSLYPLFSRYRDLPKTARLDMEPVQKAVPMGNVEALMETAAMLQRLRVQTRILPETNSPLAALRGKSAVLVGSPWYSRSASILLEKTPWTTRCDETSKEVGLFGQGPREGRKFLPIRGPHGEYQEVFGLVSVLPNDNSSDAARTIVVLSGLTSVGIHGAASFFASGKALKGLEERFRKQGISSWPRSYQVIVRCRASDDAELLSATYETHEVLAR